MTHEDVRELIPVFALDALADDESNDVRSHLDGCQECQELLAGYQQTTASLALDASPVSPPPSLRARILEAADKAPQEAVVLRPASLAEPAGGGSAGAGKGGRAVWAKVTALVAVAAVIALAGVGLVLNRRLHDANHEVAAQRSFIQHYVSGPIVAGVTLVAAGDATKANGHVFLAADERTAGLVASGLGPAGTGIYKVWLIVNNQPVGVATFKPDAAGVALVPLSGDLASMQAMAVTLEPHGSDPTPQGPRVLQSS